MKAKTNHKRWLLCVLFVLAVKQMGVAHIPPPDTLDQATIIYVDDDAVGANDGSSWTDAFSDLQDAFSMARAGDEIHVAEGVYTPDKGSGIALGDRTATFQLINGVALMGGYAGLSTLDSDVRDVEIYETILSGDLEDNDADVDVNNPYDYFYEPTRRDNSVHVITSIADDESALLDGFVVTGAVDSGMVIIDGSPTIFNCVFKRNSAAGGGAIYILSGQSLIKDCKFISNLAGGGGALYGNVDLTLSECSFTGNWAQAWGGSVLISGNAVLTGCVFRDNTSQSGGGIVHLAGEFGLGKLELIDCAFLNNSAISSSDKHYGSGGAVYTYEATANNCIFSGNWARQGGAIYGEVQSIENCTFFGNTAEQGGALRGMQGSMIRNSIFAGNRAEEGGVLYSIGPGLSLIGCTLSDNSAQYGNTINWISGSRSIPVSRSVQVSMTISNCILWNGGDEIGTWIENLADISIIYSNIQGGWSGEGNIDLDPSFADPGYWDSNGTPNDPNDDFWIDGDYHLKSEAGRWDPISESWVIDDITSPCIDAGDPNSPVAFEPFPNGGIINMGAYGGSSQASKSPSGIHAKYGGGTGESNDPYLIYTAEQMNAIGDDWDEWDKHFKLMADIDLSGYVGTDFNIIGNDDSSFRGIFDGDGHTISNFSYTSSNGHFTGLFGYIFGRNAQIKDLGLKAPNVNAGTGRDVGSLAGQVISGTIMNCYAEGGSVAGDERIGGLVGSNFGNLKDCSSTCSVSGNEQIGGLVGYNTEEITNCYAGGEVFGRQDVGGLSGSNQGTIKNSSAVGNVGGGGDYVGGLVGNNYGLLLSCSAGGEVYGDVQVGGLAGNSSDVIVDCYATGGVSGTKNVGGLVGRAYDSIINCYAIGGVSGTTNVGGLVGQGLENYITYGEAINSFWDVETSGQVNSDGGTGKTTAQMKDSNTFMDMGWDFVAAPDGPSDIWAEPDGGGYPILWWQLSPLSQLPNFSGGTGVPDDPYLVSTADELNSIGHNPRLMSAHFQLINDIDFSGIDFFIIGDQWYPFGGTFDGNTHTISNFGYTSPEASYIGLFRYVVGCQIKDLGLIDSYISIDRGLFHGGLVGYLEGGAITNCYVEAGSISGNDYVGGLVGISRDLNRSGIISNCYVRGSVAGDDEVGGLVGNNGAAVTECYATGSVAGDDDVGGLVGSNAGTITDCYAIVDVDGSERVGGLVGACNYISFGHGGIRSRIERCYAAGRVSGDEQVSGLAGQNNEKIENSFWDFEASGQSTSDGGVGKMTAEMQTAGTFLDAGWDFVNETENGMEDIWWILEGQDYPRLWWESTENPMLNN